MTEEGKPDMIFQLDQMQAMLENIAKLLADYYGHLLNEGIPAELAGELVKEYQRIMLNQKNP